MADNKAIEKTVRLTEEEDGRWSEQGEGEGKGL